MNPHPLPPRARFSPLGGQPQRPSLEIGFDQARKADYLQSQAMGSVSNIGEGVSQLAHALAYRRNLMNDQQKAAGDPWSGMRQATTGGPLAGLRSGMQGLFGMGR